jgi:hypothetical protein
VVSRNTGDPTYLSSDHDITEILTLKGDEQAHPVLFPGLTVTLEQVFA